MKDLNTADKAEMREFAREVLGITMTGNLSEDKIRERIRNTCIERGIDIPVSGADAAAREESQQRTRSRAEREGWPTIMIPDQDKPGGNEPVFVGANGKGYTIPRNVDVQVPHAVVEILKNARQEIVTQRDDGSLDVRKVLTYPYQVIDPGKPRVPPTEGAKAA